VWPDSSVGFVWGALLQRLESVSHSEVARAHDHGMSP
jgi:hypothetical protein